MELDERPAARMKLVGGRLFLDFINTVGGRRTAPAPRKTKVEERVILNDKLTDYLDLVAWSRHTGIFTDLEIATMIRESSRRAREAAAVFRRAVDLREALYRICTALLHKGQPLQTDIELLNAELVLARSRERLAIDSDGFVWEWSESRTELDRMLWPVASTAAEFLTTADVTRLRECERDTCRWLFEDTSRNRSRQWCSMQDCGNLSKVRRFRTRLAAKRT
jgi:predicted RNA-binding Zn ribbon-like protein